MEKIQLLFYRINKGSRESAVELLRQLSSKRSYRPVKHIRGMRLKLLLEFTVHFRECYLCIILKVKDAKHTQI